MLLSVGNSLLLCRLTLDPEKPESSWAFRRFSLGVWSQLCHLLCLSSRYDTLRCYGNVIYLRYSFLIRIRNMICSRLTEVTIPEGPLPL